MLRHSLIRTAGLVALILAPLCASAATITKTTTFNPGFFFGSTFTYSYVVTATPAEIPFNDVHINVANRANINLGSYAGPGAAAMVPGAGASGTLTLTTAGPAGFGNPLTFSVDSIANPNFVEGAQSGFLTLNGVPIPGSNDNFVAYTPTASMFDAQNTIAFDPGTFGANAIVDVFQNGFSGLHLGSAMAGVDGSAVVSLFTALSPGEFLVGEDGVMAFSALAVAVPAPAAGIALMSGLALLVGLRRRRQI